MKSLQFVLSFAVLTLTLSRVAHAQLLFSFDPAEQTGMPGTSLTYSGTLTNIGADIVYLNGAAINLSVPGITTDTSLFLFNAPFSLGHDGSFSGDLFDVMIAPTVASGQYVGSFAVLGGATSNLQDILATQNFLVTVSPAGVPEPGSLVLIGVGLLVGLPLLRRRKGY